MNKIFLLGITFFYLLSSCKKDTENNNEDSSDCANKKTIDRSRGDCNESVNTPNTYSEEIKNNNRVISTNNIPEHKVGLFGKENGALNPNKITKQSSTYTITALPEVASSLTSLLSISKEDGGPKYSFGILKNGIELDPVAAEPFPHESRIDPNNTYEWNLEALNVNLGLDCNNAHVQPNGKYHYHGIPTLYIEGLNTSTTSMDLIGYAADGFPIYNKYAYSKVNDITSPVIPMTSSYKLKNGDRPGDGSSAPCGPYDGVYTNDYEYIPNLGTLDEANGRTGYTPEYPSGTYYYVITDEFPSIPRYFKGSPSDDFKIGQ